MAGPHRALVVGALGRMGRGVRAVIAQTPELRLGAALESAGHPRIGQLLEDGITVGDDAKAALSGCDVAIDFSVPAATVATLRAAAEAGVAYVAGTTGLSDTDREEIARAAERIPVVHAPNFSLAVNVLVWLAGEAARRLGEGFGAEILEIHHAAKRDAPSGTALRPA